MKKKLWVILLAAAVLLISVSAVFAFDFAPQLEILEGVDLFDGISDTIGKIGTQMVADGASNLLKDGFNKFLLWIGIKKPPTFWEENKTVVTVALIGLAILIGMIIYDRSKARGRTQHRRARSDSFSFDDRDADIFGDGEKSAGFDQPRRSGAYRSRRPDRDPFSDQQTDLFSDGRSAAPHGMAASRLIGLEGDYAGKSIPLSRDTLTIGRSRDCNLVMRNYVKGISKTHCAIRFSSSRGAYQIMDLGSTYGTYVNGKKIAPKTAKTLNRNDVINLGSKRVGFRVS